jgi:hypothetical protein
MRFAIVLVAIAGLVSCHNSKAPYPSDWPMGILTMPESMHDFEVLSQSGQGPRLITQEIKFKFLMSEEVDAAISKLHNQLMQQRWQKIRLEDERPTKREYENINSHLVVEVLPKRGKNATVIICTYTHFAK